jgi:uncharacterized phosphosugar-binding protein
MEARKYVDEYFHTLVDLYKKILEDEFENITAAAELLVQAIKDDHLIHIVGSGGHSFMAAEELFYRTGGLVPINPIFEQGLTVVHGALRSTMIERLPGYMVPVLDYYRVGKDDVLFVVNAYGINCATIDSALEGKKRGAKIIAVSSSEFAKNTPSDHPARHPSKKSLHELEDLDIFIDNKMPYGDAVIAYPGFAQKVGPVSSMVNFFVLNEIVIAAVAGMLEADMKPPVWTSMNVPDGAEKNKQHIERYFDRIKHM